MEDTARAELATAGAARDASDFARGIAAEVTIERPPTARIRDARQLRVLALAVLDRSVILEAIAGTSWEDIAEALMLPVSDTIRRYGPSVERFRNGVTAMTIEVEGMGPMALEMTPGLPSDSDPVGTAEAIDAWLDRQDDIVVRGPRLAERIAP